MRPYTRRLLGALCVLATLIPAGQAAACPGQNTAPAFAAWGDDALYVEAPGGLFSTELGWAPVGAPMLAAEANPFAVDESDTTSARLAEGDSITSPPVCLSRWHPHLRFAARSEAGTKAHLELEVLWTDDKGNGKIDRSPRRTTTSTATGSSRRTSSSTRSFRRMSASATCSCASRSRRVRGRWLVDNVFVDPVKSG